jgi:hypothetical protein
MILDDGLPLRRLSRLRRPWIFTLFLLGVLAVYGASVIGADAAANTSGGSLSFHAEIGGQNSVPGGTYALGQQTSAMSLMFERTNLWDGFGLALRYLNEGYLGPQNAPAPQPLSSPLHYKDAFALLLTRWWPVSAPCHLGAAIGPETYFDTTATEYRAQYGDRHGLGLELNVAGRCDVSRRLSVELTATRSLDVASFDSSTVLVGFVFTPSKRADAESSDQAVTPRGQVELTAGRVDIDDFDVSHDDGTTTWISYDRLLHGSFGFEASLLRERVANVVDRRGGAIEFTAEHAFWVDWLHVFAGVGPYLAHTIDYDNKSSSTQINLLISYGIRIAILKRLSLMAKLGRVAASAGRDDSDLATVGFSWATP